jgi:hypothetical protein
MLKRLIRDLLGKRTEKKALNPDVRGMLLNLDGVYEKISTDSRPPAASEQHVDATRKP